MPEVFTRRLATPADIPALTALAEAAIGELLGAVLPADQVAASRAIMGIDTRLIEDRTYFVMEEAGRIAGCGGWSCRATPYGGDHTTGRDDRLLDPVTEAAKVRAMYTHPDFKRRGVGRLVLEACEAAARAEGFKTVELTATAAGEPFYAACGYVAGRRFVDDRGGAAVPLCLMRKSLEARDGQS